MVEQAEVMRAMMPLLMSMAIVAVKMTVLVSRSEKERKKLLSNWWL